jgi:hypothetical protein
MEALRFITLEVILLLGVAETFEGKSSLSNTSCPYIVARKLLRPVFTMRWVTECSLNAPDPHGP